MSLRLEQSRKEKDKSSKDSEKEHVLVCLTLKSSENNAMLKYASKLAGQSKGSLYAVHVQPASENGRKLSPDEQKNLYESFNTAQQMGAAVFSYKGDDFVKSIIQCAREYKVGKIIISRNECHQSFMSRLLMEKSIVERFLSESKGISLIISDPEKT